MREVAAALRAPEDERVTEDAGPLVAPAGPRVPSLMHAGLRAPARRRTLWPAAVVGGIAIASALAFVAWPRGSQPASSPVPATEAPPTASSEPPPTEPPPPARIEPPPSTEPAAAPPTASTERAPLPTAAAPVPKPAHGASHRYQRPITPHKPHTTQGETLD
jgi:hypothetical protein